MSEQQVLPELDVIPEDKEMGGNSYDSNGDITFMEHIGCRERQLAQSEAERERLQGELKHHEETPFFTRNLFENDGQMKGKDYADLTNEDLAELFEYSDTCKCQGCSEIRYMLKLRAGLAREREANQWLRQVVKKYREEHEIHSGCDDEFGRCTICKQADLLEPRSAPVATTS